VAFQLLQIKRGLEHEARATSPNVRAAPRSTQAVAESQKGNLLRYIDSFPNPIVQLAECIRLGLEGIVCKRKDAPYRSGPRSGWIKVKTEEWKAANRYRATLFAGD
jgi:hypothetical protein